MSSSSTTLFASIDIGTNSFKLHIIRAHPTGKLLTLTRHTHPIHLSPSLISSHSLHSLLHFKSLIASHNVPPLHTLAVATHSVRQAPDQAHFLQFVHQNTGFQVNVLTGQQEAKFVYLGVLHFLPVYQRLVLCVDIGGGSTEFVIGRQGKVVFCQSLELGHVSLSERFGFEVLEMRECVRRVVEGCGLVEEVKRCGFEVAVGACGTVRAIEKAVFKGFCGGLEDNVGGLGECRREWRLRREEVRGVVERLCGGEEDERGRRERFFKRRAGSIVAGGVLLEEIFGLLGIEEMEVSGYGLGEGVIAERLGEVFEGYDLNANARWRSVVRLAMRFNGKKRIKCGEQCASIAKVVVDFRF